MSVGYGIDFGTTNSIVAKFDTRISHWQVFHNNGRPHPSVVWYKADRSITVGTLAKENINRYSEEPGNKFVSSVKRRLGKKHSYHMFGQDYKAFEVASAIFRHLKETALRENDDIAEAIVTIPVDFDGQARRELREAADKAGIHIKKFIHEPFAAIVAHCWKLAGQEFRRKLYEKNFLVMDWGGGTLDISIAKVENSGFRLLAFEGQNEIGGDIFDEKLAKWAQNVFLRQHKIPSEQFELLPATRDRIKIECENAKIKLSSDSTAPIEVPNFSRLDNKVLHMAIEVKRSDFEDLIRQSVDIGIAKMLSAIEKADLTAECIDSVLLIGGTGMVPLIRARMAEIFGSNVSIVENPDSIIAEGAALIDALGMEPILQDPLSIELANGSHFKLYDRDSQVRHLKSEKNIQLYCTDPRDGNAKIVMVNMSQPKDTKGILSVPVSKDFSQHYNFERVYARFFFDHDMVLHAAAHSATRQKEGKIEIFDIPFGLSLLTKGS